MRERDRVQGTQTSRSSVQRRLICLERRRSSSAWSRLLHRSPRRLPERAMFLARRGYEVSDWSLHRWQRFRRRQNFLARLRTPRQHSQPGPHHLPTRARGCSENLSHRMREDFQTFQQQRASIQRSSLDPARAERREGERGRERQRGKRLTRGESL
jgi:hypothetical protein